jgi:hypothetical protein
MASSRGILNIQSLNVTSLRPRTVVVLLWGRPARLDTRTGRASTLNAAAVRAMCVRAMWLLYTTYLLTARSST